MDRQSARRKVRTGLQIKAALSLTFVVLAAISAGGWLYYMVTARILHDNDRLQAESIIGGLTGAAAWNMANGDTEALRKLIDGLLEHPKTLDAVLVDRGGNVLTSAGRVGADVPFRLVTCKPAAFSYELLHGEDFLEIGRPIVLPGARDRPARLVGGIRLLLDTRETARILAGVQQEIFLVAALVLACAIPVGLVLVWRVVCQPVRRLMTATARVADGDFSTRVQARHDDEIGELARSFNIMTERLAVSRQQLRMANELLERKVAERTGELEQANRRLREEIREKEDFLRAVSHDLSAPLRNIAGMATMISVRHRGVLPQEVLARLDRIQANVQAETELIDELLELSRIRTRPERRQLVDFASLLQELAAAFEFELKGRHIALHVHRPMPALYVERNRMRQVFQNLIDNAIKYMHRDTGGRIDVRYELAEGMHRFSVADNGPGIAPQEQERIFYVFRRAASAANAQLPGRGVGLALVRSVAHNYQGWAWVSSRPGQGATFCVALDPKCTVEPPRPTPGRTGSAGRLVDQALAAQAGGAAATGPPAG